MSLSHENWMKRLMYTIQPSIVIYAAGHEAIPKGENKQRELEALHVDGAALVAKAAELFAPKFIYLSNCYTFDGRHGNYRESDPILPSNALGKAKLSGENSVKKKSVNWVIIRSSPLYGIGNPYNLNLLDQLRIRLERRDQLKLDNTKLHSFTPVMSLANLVERLIHSAIKNRVLHLGGLTKLTSFELALEFAKRFGYDSSLIHPKDESVKLDSDLQPLIHSWDYSLNSTQVIESLKIQPLLLQEGFDLIEKQPITSS